MQRLKFVWTKTNAWGNFIATNLRTKFCSLRGPLSSTVFLIAQLQSKHTWSAVPKCSERKVRNVKWVFFCNYLFCLFVLKTALINSSFHWFYCKLIKAFFFFVRKQIHRHSAGEMAPQEEKIQSDQLSLLVFNYLEHVRVIQFLHLNENG